MKTYNRLTALQRGVSLTNLLAKIDGVCDIGTIGSILRYQGFAIAGN